MKMPLYVAASVLALGLAYTLGPDFVRYMKIRSL